MGRYKHFGCFHYQSALLSSAVNELGNVMCIQKTIHISVDFNKSYAVMCSKAAHYFKHVWVLLNMLKHINEMAIHLVEFNMLYRFKDVGANAGLHLA